MAHFLNRVRFEDLPPLAVEHAKMIIASTLASAAAGQDLDSAAIIREQVKSHGGDEAATVWFDGSRLPVTEVVRANATASDAAASDDSHLRSIAHIGTNVATSALAVGEYVGANGKDVLTAIVAGYEASGRFSTVANPRAAGIHGSVLTVFGGSVAAARLLGLSDDELAHALCLGATSVGGLARSTNSWGREYHAGFAAVAGVLAALVAQRGFKGDIDIIDAPGGFLDVFRQRTEARGLVDGLGDQWEIVTNLMVKIRPGAHPIAAAVEAAIRAARSGEVSPEKVESITVQGPKVSAHAGIPHPTDYVSAIHSLAYYVAVATVDKGFTWDHLSDAKVADPVIARLQDLIEVEEASDERFSWPWGASVRIVTTAGETFTEIVNAPEGSGVRGIAWSDVNAKFDALVPRAGVTPDQVNAGLRMIHRFEQAARVRDLVNRLSREDQSGLRPEPLE